MGSPLSPCLVLLSLPDHGNPGWSLPRPGMLSAASHPVTSLPGRLVLVTLLMNTQAVFQPVFFLFPLFCFETGSCCMAPGWTHTCAISRVTSVYHHIWSKDLIFLPDRCLQLPLSSCLWGGLGWHPLRSPTL